jgi:hypothetical protein
MALSINFWAVLVAAIIEMAIGALWYSQILFIKPWMRAIGKSEAELESMKKDAAGGYAGSMIAALVTAYILAHFVTYAQNFNQDYSAFGGLTGAFWAWLGFVVTTALSSVLFERRAWTLYFINIGYYLVSFLAMGALLAVWH